MDHTLGAAEDATDCAETDWALGKRLLVVLPLPHALTGREVDVDFPPAVEVPPAVVDVAPDSDSSPKETLLMPYDSSESVSLALLLPLLELGSGGYGPWAAGLVMGVSLSSGCMTG